MPPPVMLANLSLQRNIRNLTMLTVIVATLLLFNMASFWAAWFWPLVTTLFGGYAVFLVSYAINKRHYAFPDWMNLMLFGIMFLGGLQLVIGLVLVTIEEDVDDVRRGFQYVNLVTGPIITLAVFLWRTSIMRVMAEGYDATGGNVYDVNPNMHASLEHRRAMTEYIESNPSLGGARVTGSKGDYYDGPPRVGYATHAITGPADDYGYDESVGYGGGNYNNRRGGGGGGPNSPTYAYPDLQYGSPHHGVGRYSQERNDPYASGGGSYGGSPTHHHQHQQYAGVVPPIRTNRPPTADFFGFEVDPRTGRPLLVSHAQPVGGVGGVMSPRGAFGGAANTPRSGYTSEQPRDPFADPHGGVGATNGNALPPARQYLRQQHMAAHQQQHYDMPSIERDPYGYTNNNTTINGGGGNVTPRDTRYTKSMPSGFVPNGARTAADMSYTASGGGGNNVSFGGGGGAEPFGSPDARYPPGYVGNRQRAGSGKRVSFARN